MKARVLRAAGLIYRRRGLARTDDSVAGALAAVRQNIDAKRYCLLVTSGEHGPAARVLAPWPVRDDLVVYLGTTATSRKVADLRGNGRALVVYENDRRAACVVLDCHVDLLDDDASRTRYFMPFWHAFWPAGPLASPMTILRCTPDRIEICDIARGITPAPYGQVSRHLIRGDDGEWVIADTEQRPSAGAPVGA